MSSAMPRSWWPGMSVRHSTGLEGRVVAVWTEVPDTAWSDTRHFALVEVAPGGDRRVVDWAHGGWVPDSSVSRRWGTWVSLVSPVPGVSS